MIQFLHRSTRRSQSLRSSRIGSWSFLVEQTDCRVQESGGRRTDSRSPATTTDSGFCVPDGWLFHSQGKNHRIMCVSFCPWSFVILFKVTLSFCSRSLCHFVILFKVTLSFCSRSFVIFFSVTLSFCHFFLGHLVILFKVIC